MWECPRCGTEVKDTLTLCWVCGTSPDGKPFPWGQTRQDNRLDKVRLPRSVAAGVPRRFGIGKLMAITALFAVLFGLMKWLSFYPIVFAMVGVFVAGIGAAQALLFGGRKPRQASVIAGSLLSVTFCVAGFTVDCLESGFPRGEYLFLAFMGLLVFIVLGAGLGYLAGCLMAGLFLRDLYVREKTSDPPDGVLDAPHAQGPENDGGKSP